MARLLLVLESHTFPYSGTPYFEPYKTVVTPGTMISGGVSINIVPDRCEALVDIRTTPDNDVAVIEALLEQSIRQIEGEKPGIAFKSERMNFIPAVISDENASLFSILGDVIPLVKGFPAERTVAGPANEGYLLIGRGIPTICGLGPTGANAHAANEYVEIEGLLDAALIFALTASRLSN
jgi:acetylornithine deacetylase/succinyl-diaminopimelate desuccinylase-like protein